MNALEPCQRTESAATEWQDRGAPRIVDDLAERAVEVADYEQRSSIEMGRGDLNGRAD